MGKYLLKRLWQSVIAILGITVVVFVILHLTGNPVELMVSPTTPKEEMEILAEKMGFNDPLPVQYVRFLKGALVGDFGTSYYYNEPAMQVVLERAPATLCVVDAVTGLDLPFPVRSVIRGDASSYHVAAASIVAKVTRDRQMRNYALQYPEYGFEHNMGYGTAEHIAALRTHGPTPAHRRTFLRHFVGEETAE